MRWGDFLSADTKGLRRPQKAELTILKYAKCGVNYISVGALTNSKKVFDLSLKTFI